MARRAPLTIAITGGTGFIGHQLLQHHCALGDRVRVLTRQPISRLPFPHTAECFRGDLTVDDLDLRGFVEGADILYHCAGERRDTASMRALHVDATARLIDAASGRIERWVQLGSVGVYGPRRCGVVREETPPRPVGVYEVTKAESDDLAARAAAAGAFGLSVLRPSTVFGPTMRARYLYEMIGMIDRGYYFFIGKPTALMNLAFVDNVVRALYLCGTMPAALGRTFILSEAQPIDVCANTIAAALGRPAPRWRVPERPVRWATHLLGRVRSLPLTQRRIDALVSTVRYSAARIDAELGYRPVVSIDEGLRAMVAAWRIRP